MLKPRIRDRVADTILDKSEVLPVGVNLAHARWAGAGSIDTALIVQ